MLGQVMLHPFRPRAYLGGSGLRSASASYPQGLAQHMVPAREESETAAVSGWPCPLYSSWSRPLRSAKAGGTEEDEGHIDPLEVCLDPGSAAGGLALPRQLGESHLPFYRPCYLVKGGWGCAPRGDRLGLV